MNMEVHASVTEMVFESVYNRKPNMQNESDCKEMCLIGIDIEYTMENAIKRHTKEM